MKSYKNQRNQERISDLNKSKPKPIGTFEKFKLNCIGRVDGKRGLPKEDYDGIWTSPFLDSKTHFFNEFTSFTWSKLQFNQEENYVRLGELKDSIIHTKEQLEIAEKDLETGVDGECCEDVSRKQGEDRLTEAQVVARRANESMKRLAPLKGRVNSLRTQLSAEIDEFSSLRNKIIEECNSTRMICNSAKEHLYQQIAVYWSAAMKKHTQGSKMPVVPDIEVLSASEEIYMQPHRDVLQKTELFIKCLTKDETEV